MKRSRAAKRAVRSALAGLSVVVILGIAEAATATPARIVIVGRQHDDPVVPRLRAELSALGFDVLELSPETAQSASDVAAQSRDLGAAAAVRLVPSSGGIEVWVVDRVTGKTSLREVVVPEGSSADGDATIAVRAVELLRASLLEVHAAHASRGEVQATEGIRALSELPAEPEVDPWSRFGVDLGAGILASPGGVPSTLGLRCTAHWMPFDVVGLEAFGLMSASSSSVDATEGSAQLSFGLAGGGLRLALATSRSRWAPSFSAGAAGVWFHAQGTANQSRFASAPTALTLAPYVGAGVGVLIVPHVRAQLSVLGAFALSAPQVQFSGRVLADWGRPIVAPTLGAEVAWP